MPRENSFSDSDGRSLTPDLEDEFISSPISPIGGGQATLPRIDTNIVPQRVDASKEHDPRMTMANSVPTGEQSAAMDGIQANRARSFKSPTREPGTTSLDAPPQRPPILTPGDKFRHVVRKVIAMRRGSMAISRGRIGAEPGVDPRRESAFITYGHIRQKCLIEVVDYSAIRSSFGRMTNQEFISLLGDSRASEKEPWVKVRWINIGGVSWDVISALAIKYNMHPLAVEDLLHARRTARSKADYYPQHLFLRVLCHTLAGDDHAAIDSPPSSVTHLPRSSSPLPISDDEDESFETEKNDDDKTAYNTPNASQFTTVKSGILRNTVKRRLGSHNDVEAHPRTATVQSFQPRFDDTDPKNLKNKKDAQRIRLIRELKRGERVNVKIAPMCIFLFRDGTVITVHQDTKLELTAPITERLRQRDTGLRLTADASLLVESLLDLVVDQALEVVEEYQSKILKLEQAVLLKPNMKHVRRLHILQGDLILHKRTLEPIKTVIYGLRRYDVDRVAALDENVDPAKKIQGYMSHKAKIYLADVHDHMEYILSSLDMFAGISDNLINYTFNMSSYEMNEVMRRLTLATIIFLPLTLLTGYFGMNFENMWTVMHGHSDIIFWIIALPVMAIVVPIFVWQDVQRMVHYLKKRWVTRNLKKKIKQA